MGNDGAVRVYSEHGRSSCSSFKQYLLYIVCRICVVQISVFRDSLYVILVLAEKQVRNCGVSDTLFVIQYEQVLADMAIRRQHYIFVCIAAITCTCLLHIRDDPVLMAICAGNSPVTCEFPSQRPVTQSFGAFFGLRLNKGLSQQSRRQCFEMPSRSLWSHCSVCGPSPCFLMTHQTFWKSISHSTGAFLMLTTSDRFSFKRHHRKSTQIQCNDNMKTMWFQFLKPPIIHSGEKPYFMAIFIVFNLDIFKTVFESQQRSIKFRNPAYDPILYWH